MVSWKASLIGMGLETGCVPVCLEVLKKIVRDRDRHKCVICGKPEDLSKNKISTHHIDGNRENDVINNLITVCDKCHADLHKHLNKKQSVRCAANKKQSVYNKKLSERFYKKVIKEYRKQSIINMYRKVYIGRLTDYRL